jgi:hypothetical protein
VLIIATAALGLSLVGALAIRMTPGATPHRDAFGAVTSSSVLGNLGTDSFAGLSAARSTSRLLTELLSATLSSIASDSELSAVSTPLVTPREPAVRLAVVTPIGSDGLGVTTEAAVAGRTGVIEAMLPTGATVTAELVGARNGVAIVELPEVDDDGSTVLAEAKTGGDDDLTVLAYGDEFSVGEDGAGLQSLDVPEAAPVVDDDGNLIGLCTIGPDGIEMLPVETLPDLEPPTPPPPESSETVTTAVTTEPDDSAVATTDSEQSTEPSSAPTTESPTEPPSTPLRTTSSTAPPTTEPPTTDVSIAVTSEPTDTSVTESSATD